MSVELDDGESRANFTQMAESSFDDWVLIGKNFTSFQKGLPNRIMTHLRLLDGDFGGYPVDRLEHSVQTATRAYRAGMDEEYVVCALLHDIGDTLASANHADVAAAILKPYICEKNLWMIEQHALFQGYYFFHHIGLDRDAREKYRGHPHFDYTAKFCHVYDQAAFDPNYDTMPLEAFEPMVHRLFAMVKNSIYKGGNSMPAES